MPASTRMDTPWRLRRSRRALRCGWRIPKPVGGVDAYRRAARNAITVGFDGVELHGGNGYLIDQFLRVTSNARSDRYGGSAENRLRFLLEATHAVATEVGADRTGIRLSPFITERGMHDDTAPETVLLAARMLDRMGIAYLHLVEADWDDQPKVPGEFRVAARQAFSRKLMVAGRFDRARAEAILEFGLADLVAFGRPFIANPDLPSRLAKGIPLAHYDPSMLYGGGATGYADYPFADTDAPAEGGSGELAMADGHA